MALVRLKIPPGMTRPGTVYEALGRWYDGNLVRWHEGTLQPWGGWRGLENTSLAAVNGAIRGMRAWRRSNGVAYIAIGSTTRLLVYSGTTLSNITPSGGLTAGDTDASGDFYNRTEASSWQMDVFGEDLVAVSYADGALLYWNSSSGVGTPAAALSGAPSGNIGVAVTPERFIVALGADSDRRKIAWCDQEDPTDWTPTATNQAGDFILPGDGQIMSGRSGQRETLIWTDIDLWAMRYIGGTLVYSINKIGDKCGAISRRSMAVVGSGAFWMGARGFYHYDGFVKPLPSDVGDYVFGRLNREQASKIAAVVNSDFNEVTWYYPSTNGDENDSYVTYNYQMGIWYTGAVIRSDGIDRGFLEFPVAGGPTGALFETECGTSYTQGGSQLVPYIESGPIEIAEGDRVMDVVQYVPDEKTLGEVQTTIYSRMYPTASETTHGPYTNANPTDVRITARQIRLRHTQVTAGWRVGTPRIDTRPGSRR